MGHGKLALRAGNPCRDTSQTAKYTMCSPMPRSVSVGLSLNHPSGGPSPPLAAMGACLRAEYQTILLLLGGDLTAMPRGPGLRPR